MIENNAFNQDQRVGGLLLEAVEPGNLSSEPNRRYAFTASWQGRRRSGEARLKTVNGPVVSKVDPLGLGELSEAWDPLSWHGSM